MLTTKEMSQNDFMQFANGHPDRNFWQTDMMADLQSNKGLTTLYLGVYENSSDQPVAAAMTVLEPAHFGLFHARSPRGPLMDFTAPPERIEAVIRAFHDDLSHRKVMYWTIDPYIAYCKRDLEGNPISKPETALHQTMLNIGFEHEGFNVGIDNSREPQWIHIVPTAGMNEASLQKSFLRKAQRNIKDAFTSGVEVWQMEEKDLHLLDELLEDTAKRKGFTWRSSDYHQQLYRSFVDKDGVRFLAASIDLQEYLDRMNKELAEVEADLESVEHNLEQNAYVAKKIEACYWGGKYVAAICAAPSILGHMSLLEGKRATCYPGFEKELLGAEIVADAVVTDGKIITARGAGVANQFAFALAEALCGKDAADELKAAVQWQ